MKKGLITILILTFILSIFLVSANETRDCRNDCLSIKNIQTVNCSSVFLSCKEDCNWNRVCLNKCNKEKINCLKLVNSDYSKCSKKCAYLGKNITCLGGKYNAGDVFLDSCQICECGYNSRVSCKKTDFCNFNEFLNDSSKCESNNGLFQQLCNGPYFDIVCSHDNYCLCSGFDNYSCPENYYCLHNFSLSLTRRGYTIAGWKTLLGVQLGDIGICVKKQQIDSCGNGVCENIVKPGKEAETFLNCPEDCK